MEENGMEFVFVGTMSDEGVHSDGQQERGMVEVVESGNETEHGEFLKDVWNSWEGVYGEHCWELSGKTV